MVGFRYGVPTTVMTSQGCQSESHLWTQLMHLLGATSLRTTCTSYHPPTNGSVKHFHCQLKITLKSYPNPDRRTQTLTLVLLGTSTALKTNIGCSAAELVFSTTLRLPDQIFDSDPSHPVPDPASYVTRLPCRAKETSLVAL